LIKKNPIIQIIRPQQWYKNFLVFIPLIFSLNAFVAEQLLLSIFAFITFCLSAGGSYVINDLLDIKNDLLHPLKKNRPLPSGRISKNQALMLAVLLIVISEILAFFITTPFFIVNTIFILLTISYSIKLKHIFLLDVFIIPINYVLRAVGGVLAIDLGISPWLIIGIFFSSCLLVLGKRKNELLFLKEKASEHRKVLSSYTTDFLNFAIGITAATIIVTYSIYAINGPQIINDWRLVLTIPVLFFIITVFVERILSGKLRGGEFNDLLFSDRKLLSSIIFYVALVFFLLYLAPSSFFV